MTFHPDLPSPHNEEVPDAAQPGVAEPSVAEPSVVGPSVAEHWAAFQNARAELAAVMTDDELREFGFNVEVLDEAP